MKNEYLNMQLMHDGYVILPSFLNKEEVAAARNLFFKYHPTRLIRGFYVASNYLPLETQLIIHEQLGKIFTRSVNEYFCNMRCLGGTFMVKGYDPNDILHPHQDWSIVDERYYRSYTIWVALQDISEDNGAMYVLPGSHEKLRGFRHYSIPSIFGQIYDVVWQYMQPVYLKTGDALVFDHALGHASKPNNTTQLRIAATNSLLSENAEYRFYFNNQGTIEEYIGEPYYYITEQARYSPGNLKKIRSVAYKIYQLDERQFCSIFGPHPKSLKNKWQLKLAKWWRKISISARQP